MQPIVRGIEQQYGACLTVTHLNFHAESDLRRALQPIGTPEFFLLDASGAALHRWIGEVEADEFRAAIEPLCETSG